jgi:two-component system NtrC family response regulator
LKISKDVLREHKMEGSPSRVLLVDDDDSLREILRAHLKKGGYDVVALGHPQEAVDMLERERFEILVTDIKMEGLSGIELLKIARDLHPGLPVIMITGHGTIESAVESMKLGAFDYVTKPVGRDEFLHIVGNALRLGELEAENVRLRHELKGKYTFEHIIGKGESMSRVFSLMEKVIETDTTVLILGESGTGKELVARALHYNGPRTKKPFVVVNCASIPDNLMESELFGHVKGAFTGAQRDRDGKFQLANGGTLFLDEIGDLKLDLQAKLLRVLQESEVERLGEGIPRTVDVRVITATHRNLEEMIQREEFRDDLYYRISVYPIQLPPLRDRSGDLTLLVNHFIEKYSGEVEVRFNAKALEILKEYLWPGNVRELENVVERALILKNRGELGPETLPSKIRQDAGGVFPGDIPDDGLKLEELEVELIKKALEKAGGNQTRAAKYLGISRPTLIYRMEKYEIQ